MTRPRTFSALLLAMSGAATIVHAGELKPFEASYMVSWHGMNAGTSTMTFEAAGGNNWVYHTANEPHGLFRAFLPDSITQRSEMRLTDKGIQPIHYVANDGTASKKRAMDLRFDWQRSRVTGTLDEQTVDVEVAPGTQDDLSVQIALVYELDNGRTPESFKTYGDRGAREYKYIREGSETLQTPLGSIETNIYRTERSGSPRVTRYWCAPSLGYLPLKAQQKRDGDVEWTMEIQKLKRG
jgi:Protein of unknown function (DUF3108)